jgi:four helix bundle protein
LPDAKAQAVHSYKTQGFVPAGVVSMAEHYQDPSTFALMGHFRDLKAWQHARTLAVLSKAAIARLPESEKGGLADQWRRASYSVVLNIAEGASRRGGKEFRRFLDIARASLHEIEAIIDLALALDYFRPDELATIQATREECAKTVYGLLRKLSDSPKQSAR